MNRRTFFTALTAAPGVFVMPTVDAELTTLLARATPEITSVIAQLLRVVEEHAAQRAWLDAEDARRAALEDAARPVA